MPRPSDRSPRREREQPQAYRALQVVSARARAGAATGHSGRTTLRYGGAGRPVVRLLRAGAVPRFTLANRRGRAASENQSIKSERRVVAPAGRCRDSRLESEEGGFSAQSIQSVRRTFVASGRCRDALVNRRTRVRARSIQSSVSPVVSIFFHAANQRGGSLRAGRRPGHWHDAARRARGFGPVASRRGLQSSLLAGWRGPGEAAPASLRA